MYRSRERCCLPEATEERVLLKAQRSCGQASPTLVLTSKGVAGVPRATLVVLLATASTFHLPTEPIFVILGIDALMDMARTAINVVGNCLASAVVAQWEGVFGTETPDPVVLEGVD